MVGGGRGQVNEGRLELAVSKKGSCCNSAIILIDPSTMVLSANACLQQLPETISNSCKILLSPGSSVIWNVGEELD